MKTSKLSTDSPAQPGNAQTSSYEAYSSEFFRQFQPAGALERQLLQMIVDCGWRLNRVRAYQQTLLSSGVDAGGLPGEVAVASTQALEKHAKVLANLTLYEQRVTSQFENAHKLLEQAQAERLAFAQAQLSDAARLKARFDETQAQYPQPVPYDPRNDGFDFSSGFLNSWIDRETRRAEAAAAERQREKATYRITLV